MDSKALQAEEDKQKEIYQVIDTQTSLSIKNKLLAVQKLNIERTKLQEETYENEYLNLKRQFDQEFAKINNEVSAIVRGSQVCTTTEEENKKYNITSGDNSETGISDFWATVLKNASTFVIVNENDEKILKSLIEIRIVNNEDRLSYTLEFHFAPNDYFTNEKLTKTYFYDVKDHNLCRCESSTVNWKSESLIPNKVVKTKTVKKGKSVQTQTTEKLVESLFDMFKQSANTEEENQSNQEEGEFYRDDMIPFAFEYYLQLVDRELYEGNCEDGCDHKH